MMIISTRLADVPEQLKTKTAIWHGERRDRHGYRWQTLERACRIMNIDITPHRAFADADAARKLLLKLAEA